MTMDSQRVVESVTLSQAKALMKSLAHDQSLLLLSPPGVGKSDSVCQAAAEAGLPCRSLLGTQIAPEDVSGIPRIVGERSVFCPPRVLLPEKPEPFCLFLDEFPAAAPDVQKAFYSLLLERRVGETPLPKGSWVVAAGNRAEDRALVRTLSSALVNRVIILHVRVDLREWMVWAKAAGIRGEILSFINFTPEALMREAPPDPAPFSTPRAWASLSRALDLTERSGTLDPALRKALAFGRVSAQDAAIFCVMAEEKIDKLPPVRGCILDPGLLPKEDAALWFVLCRVRSSAGRGELDELKGDKVNAFLKALPEEHRFALLVDMVPIWAELGAEEVMLQSLKEVTGL